MSAELDLARLERQVLGVARVSSFLDTVALLRRMLAAESPDVQRTVLKLVAPSIGRDLAAAVSAAWDTGIINAAAFTQKKPKDISGKPPAGLVNAAREAERSIAASMRMARKLAAAGADATTVLSPVFAAANGLKRDVATLVNAAGNAGTTAAADSLGLATVWVAETNACVECLAYSGRTAEPGKAFPGGLTYGAKSYNKEEIDYPPRHPYCRCTVEPLRSQEYADALRREADRSVIRGFSLESESMGTRVDAARRLIDSGVDAPASVLAYGRRWIKAGSFPTRGRPQ